MMATFCPMGTLVARLLRSHFAGSRGRGGCARDFRLGSVGLCRASHFVPVLEHHLAGNSAVGAHDATAGMRCRAAHVEAVDGRAVVSPSGNRAEEKKLLEGKFALKNIALREAEFALEVEWG